MCKWVPQPWWNRANQRQQRAPQPNTDHPCHGGGVIQLTTIFVDPIMPTVCSVADADIFVYLSSADVVRLEYEHAAHIWVERNDNVASGVVVVPIYYHPLPIVFDPANGAKIWDPEGKEYIDMLYANSLSIKFVQPALANMDKRLVHNSNYLGRLSP
ncbi:hypothetical protein F5J12DRAFT_925117 [Pisolithus orientalis]|uniref:uncharacterized protein n=1 Tax=Pisolithus orientalis TaxID=936130 RepID=UPI00222425A1|nr:uncharacterized protein F5J12DRAFT_925117 [Pisolithus orientalis]KAI6030875.1 hypothetical protein F5J12DRAFT_925117 [Pisolithus orientalis]